MEKVWEIIFGRLLDWFLSTKPFVMLSNLIYLNKAGIKRIHNQGKDLRSMIKAIEKAYVIKFIAFMPHSFVFDHKHLLVEKIKSGCHIRILVCEPSQLMLTELSRMENRADNDISNLFDSLLNLLKSIKKEAGKDALGSIELRTYNTEARNPATICIDHNGKKSAFLTVSTPPKRSIDTIMLEYRDDYCDSVIDYFDKIWELHENDVVDI